MKPGRSFLVELDLTPEALIEAMSRDRRVVTDLRAPPDEAEQIFARVDGRWLELRHTDSAGLTPVLCVELEALRDGGTRLRGRWVHGPWEVGMRALWLLYGSALLLAVPVLWSLPSLAAVALAGFAALCVATFRPVRLKGDRRVEAESIARFVRDFVAPYRRDLPPGAGDPFRRPALTA